jgi:hypothetical protein
LLIFENRLSAFLMLKNHKYQIKENNKKHRKKYQHHISPQKVLVGGTMETKEGADRGIKEESKMLHAHKRVATHLQMRRRMVLYVSSVKEKDTRPQNVAKK